MKGNRYYKRPDGLYVANRTINGKRKVFYAKSVREMDKKILEYNGEIEKGEYFCKRADQWERMTEPDITESTRKHHRTAVKEFEEVFAGRRCSEIKPIDVLRYVRGLERKGYAKITVSERLSNLRQILSYAVLEGDMDVNPAAEVKLSSGLKSTKRTALTEEQQRKVEQCRSGEWWLLGYMLLYTGARKGELLALNWQDVDRENGVIHFSKKLNYAYNPPKLEDRMKSKNGVRDCPIFPALARALPKNRIGKIFSRDGEYLTEWHIRKAWAAYCKEAGLIGEDGKPEITMHQLRHTFATVCYEADVSIMSAAKWMGDTPEVVGGVYQELRTSMEQDDRQKMESHLESKRA